MKHTYSILLLSACSVSVILCSSPVQSDVQMFDIHDNGKSVFVTDESWQPEGFEAGTTIPAPFIDQNIVSIDGFEDEPAWRLAPEITVPLSFGSVGAVSIKALYSPTDVFIRVRWPDSTEDREHHPWVWNEPAQEYTVGPQIEDSIILSFEAGCEWYPSFLAGYQYDFDGWQWQAARSDPNYQAVDLAGTMQSKNKPGLSFVRYDSRNTDDIWLLKFIDRDDVKFNEPWENLDRVYMKQDAKNVVYYRGVPDGTRGAAEEVEPLPAPKQTPANGTGTYARFLPVRYDGQAGEVAAKGHWQDGYWTVEFQRVRVTPAMTRNDTMFTRLTQFSVHVFDHVERVDQSSESDRLFLRFLEPQPVLVNK